LSTLILRSVPLGQASAWGPHDARDCSRDGIDDPLKKNLNFKKKRFMVPCDWAFPGGINAVMANNS